MKKIEFLRKLFDASVESTNCGQCYYWSRKGSLIWVDNLSRGRVSIKLKYFSNEEKAQQIAGWMLLKLHEMPESVIDAATKADVYKGYCARFPSGYVARLICDRHW